MTAVAIRCIAFWMKISLCRNCSKKFKARRGKRYCSDMCRYEAWKLTSEPCFYCGCAADTTDHVPPRSARAILLEFSVERWPFIEVPACHECNCALGARPLWTLPERKAFVKKWIRKRYRYYLNLPEWTEREVSKLGYNLKTIVEVSTIIAELARRRLKW